MDKKIIIIIILGLIILAGAEIYAYNYVRTEYYNQGIKDASLMINQQIISNLIQNGFITVYFQDNQNQTQKIKLIPYMEKKE